ncbi:MULTISPECIES: serine hydrolase domain-containing protein [unclassified Streptomyces]|uniref:serine hydrolase domain-containing protein n=1 Tax=unclassified Streptomyces TaxID=2593676 RepID=UPI001660D29D|nr:MULTISPECIES: serine hydrolase domain-containing protein [unclassified Streptomyces]MBD0708562.1 serine hydrolase [Streptomyces sp. CBMA291]MBD0712837.1 serine hydrolase [Streptomyces sp. CBMA370]
MTTSFDGLLAGTERALAHRVAVAQAEGRAPSFVGALVRDGALVWSGSRSCVDGHAPDADTQFRIGSITKVFTAVLVMRLRDEGLLGLDDPLERHLPGTGVGEVTIAQLLGHSGGLGAETPGAWWERSSAELRPALADVLGEEPFLRTPGRRHHYSNPGYTLLGSLIEAVRGAAWAQVLRSEILEPLGMDRTTPEPVAPHAGGWAVHPWADVMLPEPSQDLGLMAPAGQLWSTAADLARFAGFLAAGDERVLALSSLQEMRAPAAPAGEGEWEGGYGLGLQLLRRDGRNFIGHSGSLPGFVAALWVSVEDGLAGVALANATSGPLTGAVATDLVRIVAEAEPRFPEPWRPLPEGAVDEELLALTGPWYWGTYAYGLRVGPGRSVVLEPLKGAGRRAAFRALPDGTGWVGLNGYYEGETLRAVRRPDGSVSHLDLASFVFTREPYAPADVVPGGVDEAGWRGL